MASQTVTGLNLCLQINRCLVRVDMSSGTDYDAANLCYLEGCVEVLVSLRLFGQTREMDTVSTRRFEMRTSLFFAS